MDRGGRDKDGAVVWRGDMARGGGGGICATRKSGWGRIPGRGGGKVKGNNTCSTRKGGGTERSVLSREMVHGGS